MRRIPILVLVILILGFVQTARAQCVVGAPGGPTLEAVKTISNIGTPAEPRNDTVGADFHEYAAIFHDVAEIVRKPDGTVEHPCDTPELRAAFAVRLDAQLNQNRGFYGFLHGGSHSFAYLTALILGSRGELTPQIDRLLSVMPYDESIFTECGHTGDRRTGVGDETRKRWTFGDDCMDDFTVASEGFAWRAAYYKLSNRGRWQGDRDSTINYIKESLLNTARSICIYSQKNNLDPDSGPCNDTIANLAASLAKYPDESDTALIPLNHGHENSNYGIGLVSTLANSYLALAVAGVPVNASDFGAQASDVETVYKALWRQGQRTASATPDSPVNELAWASACYRSNTGILDEEDFTPAAEKRNRSCVDSLTSAYRISTYPVERFYDTYVEQGFVGDPNKFQFTAGNFPLDKFFSGANFAEPLGFFGVGRYEIYYTLTHKWLAEPNSRPELGGFTPPTCASLPAPTATVTGGRAIAPGEMATINVALTGEGPFQITWSDGLVDKDIIARTHQRVVHPTATTTYSITGFTGGECPGTVSGSATFTVRESRLFVDNVNVSAGLPAIFRATLTSDAGPLVDQELIFTILGVEAGRARTDENGRAQITYTVDVPPQQQSYDRAIKVTYAGGISGPVTSFASLGVSCDGRAFSVAPEALNFAKEGGRVAITMTTSGHCSWTAEVLDGATWLRVEPSGGSGSGSFDIVVNPMGPNDATRTAFVWAGFRRITVQQSQVCTAQLNPSLAYIPASGAILDPPNPRVTEVTTLEVSAQAGCPWTVTADDDWLHLVQPNPNRDNDPNTNDEWIHVDDVRGDGTGSVKFRADNNTDTQRRRGRLTVQTAAASSKASINQYGKPICRAPEILVEPRDGSVLNGQNVALRVYATGTELRYEWRADGEFFGVNAGPAIFLRPDHSWYPSPGTSKGYTVIVRNECGAQSARATWSVSTTSTSCRPPFIYGISSEDSPFPGTRVRLHVQAEHWDGDGSQPLHYQWYAGMTGEKTAPIGEDRDFVDVHPNDTSFYWVEVRDSCGAQNSPTGIVTTTRPPKQRSVSHDFTGDGKTDLVFHNPTTSQNELWWMNGTTKVAALSLSTNPDSDAHIQSIGDLDGDEKPDLIWRNPDTGQNSVWLMDGRHLGGIQQLETRPDARWSIGAVADLDNDEQHDIVWHNDATGENEIWFQSGTEHAGTFALPSTPDANWGLHGTGNFASDETPDLFFHNRATGENSIWVMSDERVFSVNANDAAPRRRRFRVTAHAVASQPDTNLVPAQVTDLDNDGDPDIVWRNVVTGDNSVWIMSGMTPTETRVVTPQPDLSWEIGGGGSTNGEGGEGGGTDTRIATSMTVSATTATFGNATTITATLISNGAPLASRTIVFLINQIEVTRLLTDANGSATAGASVAGFAAGTFPNVIAVRFDGDTQYASSSASADLVVTPAPATITWPAPAPIVYGTPIGAAQLNATASVAGSFSYSPAAGTILDAGYQALTATFTPTNAALAIVSKTTVLLVNKGPVAITWPPPAAIAYGTPLSAAQLNAAANIAGTFTYNPPAGTILTVGSHTLHATFTPASSDNYDVTTATTAITVIQGSQTISWPTPASIIYGTPLSATQLNAAVSTSGAAPAGALTYIPAAGTILNAGTHTLTVTAAATQFYAAASRSVQLIVVPATPAITWSNPAAITYGTPLSATQLNATANVPGAFSYAPATGAILDAGNHALTMQFTPSDTGNYESASGSTTIVVNKAQQMLTWSAPSPIVYGTALSALQLNATVSVVGPSPAGALTYTPASGTILQAGNAQVLTVNAAATPNYEPATATVAIDVLKATPVITWAQPAPIVYGTALSALQLNATVSVVGPAAAGALVYAPPAGTALDAGSHTLTVTAEETANYVSATRSVSIDVTRAPLSLAVDAKSKLYGGTLPVLTGTLTGVVNGDAITPSYATPATQQSPAGTYPITATLVDPNHRLVNYAVTITQSTLIVLPAPLLISANPAAKQYSDPLPQLAATFTGLVLGETPEVLQGTLLLTTTATPLAAPGTYPIAIGGLTSPNYAITWAGSTLTVTPEDAHVTITSPLLVSTATNAPTRVTLTATLKDVSATADAGSDTWPGDIRNATLAFVDRATNALLCSAPIGLVDSNDARIAVATCTFTRTFATGTTSLVVGASVGAYYTRDDAADNVTMTLAAPTVDAITGGGSTAGGKFNVNLKYDKTGVAKGGFTFTFERTENGTLHTYEVAATAIDSLAIHRTASGGTAAIVGTATLRDLTTPSAPVLLDIAAPLIATATDDGEPSSRDSLSVLLLKKDGGSWLATAWDGTRATAQPVAGGNLQIQYGK